MFCKVLPISNMVGGVTYPWPDDVGQLLFHSICDSTPAANSSPEGVPSLWILGSPYNFGGYCTYGIKSFADSVTQSTLSCNSPEKLDELVDQIFSSTEPIFLKIRQAFASF